MRNGLSGRYGNGLASWNQARRLAADLLRCFYSDESKPMSEIIESYNFTFPSVSDLKAAVNAVVFKTGRDKIDTLARLIMQWDDWKVPFGEDANTEAAV